MVRAFVIVCIVGLFAVPLAALRISPNYNYCVAHEGAEKRPPKGQEQDATFKLPIADPTPLNLFMHCGAIYATDNANPLTAISTVLLTIITVGLGLLAVDQNQTSRSELRAYVSARPEFIFSFDATHLVSVRFNLLNHGQTPAKAVRHRSAIELLPHPLKPGLALPAPSGAFSAATTLFPKEELKGTKIRPNAFSANEIADIINGTVGIYAYGEVEYRDAFNRKRSTTFCSVVRADMASLKKLASNYQPADLVVKFEIAPMGNKIT